MNGDCKIYPITDCSFAFKQSVKADDFFSGIPSHESIGLSFDSNTSVVPKTLGLLRSENDVREELVLMLIVSGEQSHSTAGAVVKQMQSESEVSSKSETHIRLRLSLTFVVHITDIFIEDQRILCHNH